MARHRWDQVHIRHVYCTILPFLHPLWGLTAEAAGCGAAPQQCCAPRDPAEDQEWGGTRVLGLAKSLSIRPHWQGPQGVSEGKGHLMVPWSGRRRGGLGWAASALSWLIMGGSMPFQGGRCQPKLWPPALWFTLCRNDWCVEYHRLVCPLDVLQVRGPGLCVAGMLYIPAAILGCNRTCTVTEPRFCRSVAQWDPVGGGGRGDGTPSCCAWRAAFVRGGTLGGQLNADGVSGSFSRLCSPPGSAGQRHQSGSGLPVPPSGLLQLGGLSSPPSNSSELTAFRCRDRAPATALGHSSQK